jgi:hypothetical protein
MKLYENHTCAPMTNTEKPNWLFPQKANLSQVLLVHIRFFIVLLHMQNKLKVKDVITEAVCVCDPAPVIHNLSSDRSE